jgi:hypothetical protein
MRVFNVTLQISIPDDYDGEAIRKAIEQAVEEDLDGVLRCAIFANLSAEAMPSPGAPVEIEDLHGDCTRLLDEAEDRQKKAEEAWRCKCGANLNDDPLMTCICY